MSSKHLVAFFALTLFGISCSNDDTDAEIIPEDDYSHGILVANEGPFGNGTGTVDFIANGTSTVESSIYNKVNNQDLGNIVQSIAFTEDKAFIIANVSNKITVVDRYSFEKEATITTGLYNPRYMSISNGKGYVTNWGDPVDETDDFVAIVDLETNTVESTIAVVFGPEEILTKNNKVYIAHQGAYGFNNKVSVIDANSQQLINSITVGEVPVSMQIDNTGNLWVLSSGKPDYSGDETGGVLSKIDTNTDTVVSSLEFGDTEHPSRLNFDSNNLYYFLAGGIYEMASSAAGLPTTPIMDGLSFYALKIHEGKLYGTDAKDYASNGSLTVYDLSTKTETNTYTVGLIPGGIYFN